MRKLESDRPVNLPLERVIQANEERAKKLLDKAEQIQARHIAAELRKRQKADERYALAFKEIAARAALHPEDRDALRGHAIFCKCSDPDCRKRNAPLPPRPVLTKDKHKQWWLGGW